MTIYRVGPPEGPTTKSISGVYVTIDGLQAIYVIVAAEEGTQHQGGFRAEFDGGYFTEPSDLTNLSNQELRSVTLKTPKLRSSSTIAAPTS
jgi:hypothetical protein